MDSALRSEPVGENRILALRRIERLREISSAWFTSGLRAYLDCLTETSSEDLSINSVAFSVPGSTKIKSLTFQVFFDQGKIDLAKKEQV